MMFSSSAFLVVLMLVSDGKCNGDVEPEMAGVPEPPAGVPEDTSPPPPPSNNGGAESVISFILVYLFTGKNGPEFIVLSVWLYLFLISRLFGSGS